jgi:hypothetical protein
VKVSVTTQRFLGVRRGETVSKEVNRKGTMRRRILVNIGMEERLVNVTALSYAGDAAGWAET